MKAVRCADLTGATPISDRRGHRSPNTLLMLDERDAKLVATARRFFSGMSHRETAHRLRSRLLIYQSGRWRRTSAELRPPHDADSLDAALWCLLRIKDHVPSEMTIRRALAYS